MIGNWWEERITLEDHLPPQYGEKTFRTREMSVDVHVKCFEECPKMKFDTPSVTTSQYTEDTKPELLEERDRLRRRIDTANKRKRLEGTRTLAVQNRPGTTQTPQMLSRQFIDPNKVRMKTVYQKSFNRPENTATTNRCATPRRCQPMPPRYAMTDSTWSPGWK